MAFKEAFMKSEPQLLEPIYDLEIMLPEDVMGEVMGDLQTRRSIIMGMDSNENFQIIKARTPLAELDRYSTTLRSLTQGRANFKQHFAEFATVPYDLQTKLEKQAHEVRCYKLDLGTDSAGFIPSIKALINSH
jgi:elongation factor G